LNGKKGKVGTRQRGSGKKGNDARYSHKGCGNWEVDAVKKKGNLVDRQKKGPAGGRQEKET